MTYTIEIATVADADAVAALHYLSHTESFAPFASDGWLAARDLADYQARWRETLGQVGSRDRTWVARANGRIVGMVRVHPGREQRVAELTSMHVHPDFQRRGIGRALMSTADKFMRQAGYERAILGVIQENHPARALYESAGWTVSELHPSGVEGVPIAIYAKPLRATASTD